MAQVALSADELKALEQTRQRLFQLTNNIASIRNDVLQSPTMPQWPSLQASAQIIAGNIQAITAHLSKHSELLNKTVAYPSTNYPGRTQEDTIHQLLRKKLEPPVETWVEEGRTAPGSGEEEEELRNWAKDWIGGRVAKYALEEAGDIYTVDERERIEIGEVINTGLLRKLEEDDSDEDDEDEEMEGTGIAVTSARRTSFGQVEYGMGEVRKDPNGKSRPVEDILRFTTSGVVLDHGFGRR